MASLQVTEGGLFFCLILLFWTLGYKQPVYKNFSLYRLSSVSQIGHPMKKSSIQVLMREMRRFVLRLGFFG